MRATPHGPARFQPTGVSLLTALVLLGAISALGPTASAQTTTPVNQPDTVLPNQVSLSLPFTVYNDAATTGIQASFTCTTSGAINSCVPPSSFELPADGSGNPLPTTVHVRFNSSGPGSGTLVLNVTTSDGGGGCCIQRPARIPGTPPGPAASASDGMPIVMSMGMSMGTGSGSYLITVAYPPTYTVAVSPDNGVANADANYTGNQQVFVVKDLGNAGTTYTLACSNPGMSCSAPGSVQIPKGGDSALVTVTYQAGSPTTQSTVGLTATYGSNTDGGSVVATAYTHTVSVTPLNGGDGQAVTATADQDNTVSFMIQNTGTGQASYTLTKNCPGTTCTLSTDSVLIDPGLTKSASITYHAGDDASTGTVHLTATYTGNTTVTDDGWITWTAAAPCQSADADLSPCTHAMRTVLTNTTGMKDTLTLTSLSGAPLPYTLACDSIGPVTCTALIDGASEGTVGSNEAGQIIVTTDAATSDGHATAHVVVTTPVGQVSSSFPFEILSPTSVVVSTSAGATHVDAGRPGSRSFTVHNAGHLTETFRLDSVCTGAATQCALSAAQVTLGAGADTSVSVSFVATSTGGSGTVGLTATHIRSSAVTSTATAAVVEDHAGPIVMLTPYNGDSFDPARCVAGCFAATASYTTPAYTSLDVARGVTLVYSSATADPRPIVQADVVDSSGLQAGQFSLQLKRPDGVLQYFANDTNVMFFTNAHQLRRLAVQFDSTEMFATGAHPYTLIVTSIFSDTLWQTNMPVRVLVDNEEQSPYGAGWRIAGLERDTVLGDSVLITDGTGAIAFFRRQSCSGSTCTYLSPPGDFSTLTSPVTLGADSIAYTRRAPDGTTVGFNTFGREVYVQDRFGNRTTYGYDTSKRLTTVTDPVGKTDSLHYSAAGKLDYIQDPMGRRTLITINATGDLVKIQDPAGGVPLQATYDNRHRLIKLYDRAGHFSNVGYDFTGKLAADTLPAITVADTSARPVVQYGSLAADVLIDPTSSAGTSANPAAGLDPDSVRAFVVDPRGDTTRYALNRFGQATRIEEPLGRVSTASYDDGSRVRSTIAPSGHRIDYTWSGPDLILTTDMTTGQTVHMHYEPVYHQVDTVSGDATPVINAWSNGRLIATNVGGAVTSFTYDDFGRLKTSTDPLGHVTSASYDTTGLRNRASVTLADRTTMFTHDGYGRVVTTTAPDSGVETTVYDILNRVDTTIGPIADTTIYTYSDSLHLTAMQDAKGQVYQSTFNALGWVESTKDPTDHTATAAYDLAGNAVQTVDRMGNVVTTHYNALNQADRVTADGQTTTYSADPLGHFMADSNAASTDSIFFDAAGRPTSEVTVRSGRRYVRNSTYDNLGLRTQLAISGVWSGTIGYAYDAATHQLDTLTDLAGGETSLGYNGDRLADTVRLPTTGGLTVTMNYPSTHTTSELSYSDAALNSALGASYSYSPTMQIAQRMAAPSTDGSQHGREFQYDSLQRLTGYDDYTITPDGWQDICGTGHRIDDDGNPCIVPDSGSKDTTSIHTFAYDQVGNRTDSGAVTDGANRLLRFAGDTLIYDLEGNLIERMRLAGGFDQTYGWNSLGQLTSVTTNGATVSFTYDGFGRRVSKTTSNGTTGYLYDGDNLLAELDGAGNPVAEYTYYPGIDQPHSVRRLSGGTWSTYYYAMDLPNHVVGLINNSNTLVDHYVYTPFGTLEDSSGTVPNTLRFGAREFDSETGLYYNRARYYDPTLGRFISEDPIGLAGGINPYVYAGNDPINRLDPTGTCERGWWVLKLHYTDGTEVWVLLEPYAEGDDCEQSPPPPGGGEQSNENLPSEPKDCRDIAPPAPPADNPNASIDANIAWVQQQFQLLEQVTKGYADRFDRRGFYSTVIGEWVARVTPRTGVWDYKRNLPPQGAAWHAAANFGNFNYGATCAQLMNMNACESFGGIEGTLGGTRGQGIPFISGHKGDLPLDNYYVRQGYRYATCAKK